MGSLYWYLLIQFGMGEIETKSELDTFEQKLSELGLSLNASDITEIVTQLELKDTLDKTAIGEYMGEGEAKYIAVLHAYVDQLRFAGLTFDDAIRSFLGGFRLPGEAQKIDRMMEKFAERYCACNPASSRRPTRPSSSPTASSCCTRTRTTSTSRPRRR